MSGGSALSKDTPVPKSMVEALDYDDPCAALRALSVDSEQRALKLSQELEFQMKQIMKESTVLPDLLKRLPDTTGGAGSSSTGSMTHPVSTAIACSDSILHSLTKIASGGSQASQEIQQLEEEKRELELHAQDVETALRLRKASDVAAQSLSAQRYESASLAIQDYVNLEEKHRLTDRARTYAGEYTVTQLESTKKALRATLLREYQEAVETSNLQSLGKLTPLLQRVQYEKEAVALYLRFLKGILVQELAKASTAPPPKSGNSTTSSASSSTNSPPYIPMARVYNAAVTILRHHLPMVSHCLHRAAGDAAVVQLVNVQVEHAVLPLFQSYLDKRQLARSSASAQRVYERLEARFGSGSAGSSDITGGVSAYMMGGGSTDSGDASGTGGGMDDAGFSTLVGSLVDVDASMEEAALCLQHAESYTRFIQHTVREVNKARALRFQAEQEERRAERERREWTTGMKGQENGDNNDDDDDKEEKAYQPLEILPAHTQLQETVAEVGGYYSVIESALLLASMQRAFSIPADDPRQYSSLALTNRGGSSSHMSDPSRGGPLQTSLVESCLYSCRRATQRAFATGHTGTASAVTNHVAECLGDVLVSYLSRRAEDAGVNPLKPGDGLLAGSGGIFGSTSLGLTGRQAQAMTGAVGGGASKEERKRQAEIQQGIAWACATLNDLEVAAQHTQELERLLAQSVTQGFPPNTHETEQLSMCVKSFGPVAEMFTMASDQSVESLVSILKPRIRAIVTDAVGGDHGGSHTTSGFSSVIGGSKSGSDRHAVRMNYDLDDEAYHLLEVSESYISRLCTSLDEILVPLCRYLAPRLADLLVLGVLGTVSKRLEVSLKKCRFTALGALSLDSDMRDLLNYAKDRLSSSELNSSNVALYRACTSLSRLVQIAKLMNLDDLEDVLDLISSSKRKGNWDLKLDDSKAFLSLRVEFDSERVGQLLRVAEED
jgi:conserved oligomeric Golgi complex subunit 4